MVWHNKAVRLQLQIASFDDIFRKGGQKGIIFRTNTQSYSKSVNSKFYESNYG